MYTYVHGGDIYSEKFKNRGKIFDFSANINPFGLPKGVKDALKKAAVNCADYPDPFCRELSEEVANFHNVSNENLFFSNGAADVLFRLSLAIKPKKTLLLAPTFADYEKAYSVGGSNFSYYTVFEENNFEIQENILDEIDESLDLMVICNPNNPTGKLIKENILLKVLKKCKEKNVRLLVDECFIDFVNEKDKYSFIDKIKEYNNLIILKAFTKTYAMAGVRLGYCITSDINLIKACREVGQDWSVSTLAQKAGLAAIKETTYFKESHEYIEKERKILLESLNKLGFKTYNSLANYIFFHTDIFDLKEKLEKYNIVIRSCGNYRNLGKGYYRIAVKRKTDNKYLIKCLKEILK